MSTLEGASDRSERSSGQAGSERAPHTCSATWYTYPSNSSSQRSGDALALEVGRNDASVQPQSRSTDAICETKRSHGEANE